MDWQLMILFLGYPHGQFDYIISAIKRHRPKAVVLLGDIECPNYRASWPALGFEAYGLPFRGS